MSSLRHPFILGFYGCCLYPPRVGIVMEYCCEGDLKNYISSNEDLSVEERLRILGNICSGMEYLHERMVIHRDMKSENVLLNNELDPKICDFGLSRIFSNKNVYKTRRIGTSVYMAPEVTLGLDYSEKCDIFSFSILMWEVLSSSFEPFGGEDMFKVEYKVANAGLRPNMNEIDEEIRSRFPDVIQMMEMSWKSDPISRPSFKYLKENIEKCQNKDHT